MYHLKRRNVLLPPRRLKSHLSFVIMQPGNHIHDQSVELQSFFNAPFRCELKFKWHFKDDCRFFCFHSSIKSTFLVSEGLLCLYDKKKLYVVACRYGTSLLVFNSTSHSLPTLFRKHSKKDRVNNLFGYLYVVDSIKCWSRWSLAQLTDEDCVFDELHIWHDPHGNNMTVRVLNARGLSLQLRPKQELINPYVLLYLLPNREISSHFRTNTDPETVTPKWDLSFVFSNIPESELPSRTLEVTLWSEVPGDTNIFLGESLIKMTPTLLCSGAQWFDIQDHDEASTFLPVPMRRRHTLSPCLLPPINEGNFRSGSALEVKNDSSPTGLKTANRSISTVNISTCVSQVFISESDGLTMQHRRRRRADSVVTMKAFRPKRNSNFQRMESFRRRFLDSSYKSRSAPTTPSVSIPQSMEDLRKKRAMTRSTDGLKFPLHLSDYFTSLKSAKENAHEIEFKAKEEREGKMRGALRVMKRYPANFRIRLGKLMEKPCQLGVVAEPGASGSTMSEYHDLPGYLSAPTTPNVSTSTEDLRRERSLTNYLQVPRSPGVFSIFKRRNDSQSSQPPLMNYLSYHRPHFTFPKPIHDPQFDYVDEEEVTPEERPSRDAYAGDTEAGELGIGKEDFPLQTSPFTVLLLLFDKKGHLPCLNVMDKWEIPRITVHRDSTGDHTLPASADNAPKQEAEPPAGKKGTLHALRKYSRSLRPRLSRDSAAKLTLYGEDPVKGVVGPGQLRRGSYQGHELGYLRIGLFSSRGSLEVEIIRGVSLLVLGDHPPDTYVKTYLIKDQVRLLKRKTSITRQSVNPVYNCKIKYSGCEVHNSELLVSVWCKQGIFGRKVLLGEVHIALGSLNLSVKQVAWYKLFIESQLSDD
ncbi:unnamed protein product [Pocillopora meandrina]|uniref:C2 domain-containing protein n=1 Tax=Pocillopora meandrina TaxID=46732 RepID=A0AAU9Y166_9CNID|nr:unnamed protein product [Pocillopora meandrina]